MNNFWVGMLLGSLATFFVITAIAPSKDPNIKALEDKMAKKSHIIVGYVPSFERFQQKGVRVSGGEDEFQAAIYFYSEEDYNDYLDTLFHWKDNEPNLRNIDDFVE